MNKYWLVSLALVCSLSAGADSYKVPSFRHAGPYPVQAPYMVDSLNVRSKTFKTSDLLDSHLSREGLRTGPVVSGDHLPSCSEGLALNWAGFAIQNSRYTTASLHVEGLSDYRVYVDGVQSGSDLSLEPGTHQVDIKYLSQAGHADTLSVSVDAAHGEIAFRTDGKHTYAMKDVLLGRRISGVSLSPDGRYMITSYTTTFEGGRTSSASKVVETATGRTVVEKPERMSWMPVSNRLYYQSRGVDGISLVTVDPATGAEDIIARDIPQGSFRMAPTEDCLIYTRMQEGPSERREIYQVLSPDDRQPGWRNRSYAARYDLKTGLMQQLTYGYHNSYISDISTDGRYALMTVSEERLTQRPTTLSTLYLLDLRSLEARVLIDRDGFMGSAQFSPDGRQVLLTGSPEAFGGIGMNVKPGQTPNTFDMQLYLMDTASGEIKPLTRTFDPSVQSAEWSPADGQIYFTAEDRDFYSLFRLNPKNGRITRLDTREDLVNGFSLAAGAPVLAYYGQGAMNSDRLYTMDLKSGKSTLRDDLSATILQDVELGECHEYTFKNSKGEKVCGRYYLPPSFDPSKKYPMIVNYYGGCSPTSRNFESRYPHHAYAALGYVVFVVAGPSGATGFGQEWSARHVNTAGDGPAQDIIEGTLQFCRDHDFVNPSKVGCIGASYGGFMSQYIPTQTDFFACSVSHAGISDHSSYWGYGYWGYSYSETSMANSYPWSDRELYAGHSPLYNADKIHTPILFVHGDADTNVPINESIQMFTALKLLGRETAFVAVEGQDHHILDYQKRLQWQNTIWAWFAKWLQDDPTWWDAIYEPKSL